MQRGSFLLPAMLLAACARTSAPPPVDAQAEAAAISARSDSLVTFENAKNADGALTYYLDDALVQLANAPAVKGKAPMKDLYNGFFQGGLKALQSTRDPVVVSSSGDLAYETGVNRITMTTPAGDVTTVGKYLAVWKKVNGTWMIAALAVSDDTPPTAAPAK
jgi:ketosteroid isomerase-like protein